MFQLNSLVKIKFQSKKRVGRGGSRGKNAGYGNKGQVKRSGKMRIGFEGGQKSIIKKLPKIKGLKFTGKRDRSLKVFTTSLISKYYTENDQITLLNLLEKGLISNKIKKIKIIKSKDIDLNAKIQKEDEEVIKVSKSLQK